MKTMGHYAKLAELFDYPDRDYPIKVEKACKALETGYPIAATQLEAFANTLPAGHTFSTDALYDVQEVFTRSFDVQSITTLGVGYVMFGDDYKRGILLVNLNHELREAAVECGCELPDHLPNVLRLLAKWEDQELVAEFVEEILAPALQMMIEEFDTSRMEKRNKLYKKHFKTLIASSQERGRMFRAPLAAVLAVLKQDFDLRERQQPELKSDFLKSVNRELEIELTEGRPVEEGSVS